MYKYKIINVPECLYIYIYITGAENEAHYYQKGNRKKTKIIIYNNMA